MSNIPMRFRDWWDEYDRDFDSNMSTWRWPRTSRLVDQHFGTTFRRNDLINQLANANISAPAPYFRPYSLARQDSGSTVNMAKDKFEVLLDVQQFRPDEICVKTSDKFIIVEGKHEEKQDEHGYVSRHFVRKYQLPANYKQEDVSSSLSSDGILTITAAAPPPAIKGSDELRQVPIQSVGPKKESIQQAQANAAAGNNSDEQPKIEQLN